MHQLTETRDLHALPHQEVVALASSALPPEARDCVQGRFPGFYEGLLSGFRDQLEYHCWSVLPGLEDIVEIQPLLDGLITGLVRELDLLCVRTLITAFHEDRQRSGATYASANHDFSLPDRQDRIFTQLPELRRLVDVLLQRCHDDAVRLLRWVDGDKAELDRRFGPLGRLRGVVTGLGDPHAGGLTVMRVAWERGPDLVLKPRSSQPDNFLGELRAMLDPAAQFFGPLLPHSQGHGDHVWQAFITPETIEEAHLPKWYRRLGRAAALWHCLGTTDTHYENLIATREGPVLIDAETVTSLPTAHRDRPGAHAALGQDLDSSVMRTWLFPSLFAGATLDINIAGIGGGDDAVHRSGRLRVITVVGEGTDDIRFDDSKAETAMRTNVPITPRGQADPRDHLLEVLAGYREGREFLAERTPVLERLLAKHSPGRVRQVFRPTWLYGRFLDASMHPSRLGTPTDRRKTFDQLAEEFKTIGGRAAPAVRAAEIDALMDLDVPLFELDDQKPLVTTDRGTIVEFSVPKSATESVRWWWHHVLARNIEHDLRLIRLSMTTLSTDIWDGGTPRSLPAADCDHPSPRPVWEESGRACSWITGVMVGERVRMAPVAPGLYQTGGTLAALADRSEHRGDPHLRQAVRGALRSMEMHPLTASPEAKEQWLSPFTGAFSERITSLALERRGLAQPELTTAVLQDLDAVGEDLPSLVRSTAEFDYVNGCAGTLAALAAVPHFSLSDDARTALASELQQRRTDLVDWTDPTGQLGLAHGWAGRMVGLVAADRLLGGSPATAEAVRSGLGRYLAARPLDTAMVDPASATSWCKGATGVLIALVLALEHTGHTHGQIMERIRRELRRATCSPSPGAVDISLCHGVAGQIAVVTWIGRRLSQPDLLVRARRLRCAAAEQIRRDRWRSGLAQVPETDSYFLGRSGWEHASMNLENPRWTLPMVTGGDLG